MKTRTRTRRRNVRGVPLSSATPHTIPSSPATPLPLPTLPTLPNLPLPIPILIPAPVSTPISEAKSVKVILDPSKKKAKKLVLSPPKTVVKLAPGIPVTKGKTHKISRLIRVSIDGLNKRVNRAKTIKKESESMDLEKIKASLLEASLIKPNSNAPPEILRRIYHDLQVLKQRAL